MKSLSNKILRSVVTTVLATSEKVSRHRPLSPLNGSNNFTIEPAIGSLVYCQLSTAEHSGIYIGEGKIIELTGKGYVNLVTPKGFTNNLFSTDKDIFIPVNRQTRKPMGNISIATRAKLNTWRKRDYNVLKDNCHQFSVGCMTDNFENDCNYLVNAKQEYAKNIGIAQSEIIWTRWKWYLS